VNENFINIQRVTRLDDWSIENIGRIVVETKTGYCWLCSDSIDHGISGWVPISILSRTVTARMLDLNIDLSGICASNIPCLYKNYISTVQPTLDDVYSVLEHLQAGDNSNYSDPIRFKNSSIKSYHLDVLSDYSVNATIIPLTTKVIELLPNNIEVLEYALLYLLNRTSIDLIPAVDFGELLGTPATNIDYCLIQLEKYLSVIYAKQISAEFNDVKSNLQFILDGLQYALLNLQFTRLNDCPHFYSFDYKYVASNGQALIFKTLVAEDIPYIDTDVQSKIYELYIQADLIDKKLKDFVLTDTNITFTDSTDFDHISDAISFLLTHTIYHKHDEYELIHQSQLHYACKSHIHECTYADINHTHPCDCFIKDHEH